MAHYPVVEATATSEETSATTSHTVSLPASIASDDLLIVWFGVEHSSDSTVAWPGGWTELDETFNTDVEGAVAYRIATGSEGSTITVTSGQSQLSGHIAYRISGSSGNAPELTSATGGGDASPDPPSLTPSWGAKDTLWLASEINANQNFGSGPGGFGTPVTSPVWGTDGQNAVAALAQNTATQNPATYAMFGVMEWIAHTVGVEPEPPPPLVLSRVSSLHFQRHYEPTAIGQ